MAKLNWTINTGTTGLMAATLVASSVCGLIRAMGMFSENIGRFQHGTALSFDFENFDDIAKDIEDVAGVLEEGIENEEHAM